MDCCENETFAHSHATTIHASLQVVTIVSRLEEQWQLDHKGGLLVLGHELQKDPPARTATDERTRAGPEKGEPEVLRIELQTNPPASITDEEVSAGAEKGGLGVLELNLQTGPPASTAEDERISARDLCGVTRPRSVSFQVACATHADSNFLSLGESAQNPVSTTVASPLRDAAERGDAHASETTRNGSVKRPFSGNLTRRLLNMISKWQCFGRT